MKIQRYAGTWRYAGAQRLDTAYDLSATEVAAGVEQLTALNDGDATRRAETGDGGASLTELQRAALRWLASFD